VHAQLTWRLILYFLLGLAIFETTGEFDLNTIRSYRVWI